MAATLGALPTAPAGIGTDPTAQQEYLDALTKVADSLENRGGTNYFNVAAGFLKPTRSGSFGESAGNAAEAVGKDIEREKELAPSLAMMRAQISGQKYTMQNDAKALNLLSSTLGVEPTEVPNALSNGNLNSSQTSKLQQIYPLVASLSPARGEMVKNMVEMANNSTKAGAEASNAEITRQSSVLNIILILRFKVIRQFLFYLRLNHLLLMEQSQVHLENVKTHLTRQRLNFITALILLLQLIHLLKQ